jgi:hypothetical protein
MIALFRTIISIYTRAFFFVPFCPSPCFSLSTARQDALLEYRMDAPCLPEVKDPDHYSESEMDGDVDGFASDFL